MMAAHLALAQLEPHVGNAQQRGDARVKDVGRLEAADRRGKLLRLVGGDALLVLQQRQLAVLR